jgi:hypothetical protein
MHEVQKAVDAAWLKDYQDDIHKTIVSHGGNGGNDSAVHQDVERLLGQVPGVPRGGTVIMPAQEDDVTQQQGAVNGDDSDDGPGDGGGFD